MNFVNTSTAVASNSATQMKSIEQIREEAKLNIEKRMKQQEMESKMNTIESKNQVSTLNPSDPNLGSKPSKSPFDYQQLTD